MLVVYLILLVETFAELQLKNDKKFKRTELYSQTNGRGYGEAANADGLLPKPHLSIKIRDAECYGAETTSSFKFHIMSLDFFDNYTAIFTLQSNDFNYIKSSSSRVYEGPYKGLLKSSTKSIYDCFKLSVLDCVPRADVIFIQFDNNPDDAWAIDQIDIDVYFKLGPDMEYRHKFHFEHAVLRPCYSWIADKRAYQIGPRNALFISYEYDYLKNITSGRVPIRTWV